jgi:hypothetical protein
MELLFSIVAESSIDHVATVTLPLLCPLLVIGNQALRATVSQYVSRLVSMVTQKKTDQERHEVLRDQQARLAFASTPSTTGPSQGSKVSNIHPVSVSARHADVDANVSFFSSSLYSTGSAAPAADASVTARRSVSTDDDLRTAFGF